MNKYTFDHLWSKDEMSAKKKEEEKKKQSMERSFMLYEKGKIKNEIHRIMYHKNEELKIQNELKECTWKPTLTKLNGKMEENLKLILKDTKIYNRAIKWQSKTSQKINRSKSDMHKELLDYTFKPNVNIILYS
jgi:hypothetical protein